MNKYSAFLLLAIFLSITNNMATAATGSLKGFVKDNKGLPLQGVVVEIPDLKVGTVTDSAGSYFLDHLPKGKYVIIASLISYAKASVSVTINGANHQDLVLN